jgi:folate-dependent phosphoribosylglycinamide formyltransferase PurN
MFSAVIDAMRSGALDAEIVFVFCNRDRGEDEGTDLFLDLVASSNVQLVTHSSRAFRRASGGALSKLGQPLPAWRADYDREVAERIAPYDIDVALLAGYMLIFTPEMSNRHTFLNLHPAAPSGPVGTWQEVIRQLIATNADRSGVMVHIATEELDRGPVVAYCTFPIHGPLFDAHWADDSARARGDDDPLFGAIRQHGAVREVPLIIATLQALADGRVICGDRTVRSADGTALLHGLDVTADVDALI